MKVSEKVWCRMFIAGTILLLSILGGITYVVDPFFHFHGMLSFLTYPLSSYDARYVNDGITRHFEYDTIIIGSSMTENFNPSEADLLFWGNTIKIPYGGTDYREVNEALVRAIERNSNVKRIIRCLDYTRLVRDKDQYYYSDYPTYLYDEDVWNDVEYIFNKDILLGSTSDTIEHTIKMQSTPSWDEYKNWSRISKFGKEYVISEIERGEKKNIEDTLSDDEKRMLVENLEQNVISLAKAEPEIEFYLFLPPYNICFWDQEQRAGKLTWWNEVERITIETLLPYENIKLFSFTNNYELICNLSLYKDTLHYHEKVNSSILEWIAAGEYRLTRDNYEEYLSNNKTFFAEYDYDAIYK